MPESTKRTKRATSPTEVVVMTVIVGVMAVGVGAWIRAAADGNHTSELLAAAVCGIGGLLVLSA